MRPKTAARLAWSIGIVSIALMTGALVLMFIDRGVVMPASGTSGQWSLSNLLSGVVNILVPTLGILLAARRPQNPIGWLFLVAGFTLGLSAFATSYALHALVSDPGSLPAGRAFAWLATWVGLIPLGVLAFLFLLFPTGHLRSERWRPVAGFMIGAFALVAISTLIFATMSWKSPFGQQSSGNLLLGLALFALPLIGVLAASLTALVVRFRNSGGDERQQLKWFVTAAALVVATFFASFFSTSSNSSSPPVVISVLQSMAFVFLWTAIAIAILKYRLYEIDVVISKTLVYGLLAAFFTVVYVAVVVGLGTAVGSTHNPFLTFLAAAVIALAFNPVRQRAKRLADRVVYGRRATPYEVLSEFSERMAGTFALDDILPRMARVLAEGTGGRAEIWLRVGRAIRALAIWPQDSGSAPAPAELEIVGDHLPGFENASRVTAVVHQGELLGAIAVTKPANDPLRPAEAKLIDDLAAQAGLVLRNVGLTTELMTRLEELRASRQRLVKAQDEERRRLERNIHDGAQQQLVALAVKLNLAEHLIGRDDAKVRYLVAQAKTESGEALEDLRDLARGIYPPLLADKGLAAALESQARKSPVPVSVRSDGVGRYPQEVEAAVYFCCLEALQNIAKYAMARAVTVRLINETGTLTFEVTDDGQGFDPASTGYGSGLQGMADRLDALGGSLDVHSAQGEGTTILGRIGGQPRTPAHPAVTE
jgi:signal transduction histidine kinase